MASLYRVGAMVGVFMCEVFAVSDLEFSERLRLFRHRTGLNVSNFCDKYKLPRAAYTNWEKGIKPPSGAATTLLLCIMKSPDLMDRIINDRSTGSIYKCGKELTELDAKLEKCKAFIAEWADLDKCCCYSPAIISCFKCKARELLKEIGEAW